MAEEEPSGPDARRAYGSLAGGALYWTMALVTLAMLLALIAVLALVTGSAILLAFSGIFSGGIGTPAFFLSAFLLAVLVAALVRLGHYGIERLRWRRRSRSGRVEPGP
jgi:hypothetical protein